MLQYLRDLYQTPGIKSSMHWEHVKIGTRNKKPDLTPVDGPCVDYEASHSRANL